MKTGTGLFLGLLIIGAIVGYGLYSGLISIPQTVVQTGGGGGGVNVYSSLVSLSIKGINKLTGTSPLLNGELWSNSETTPITGETSLTGGLVSMGTTLENSFNGYVMIGNDNFVSTTDRGPDYYYRKVPISWTNTQGLKTKAYDVYGEDATIAPYTFYDDNTAESTANISLATGGTYSAAAIKISSASRNCTGNPEFNGQAPLSLCFNESTSGNFKTIKPQKNSGTVPVPQFLSGKNVVSCYVIPTDALCDGNYFQTDLYFELNAGKALAAAGTDSVGMMLLDKCYFKNDALQWTSGYGYDSNISTSTDCGMSSVAVSKLIYVTGV